MNGIITPSYGLTNCWDAHRTPLAEAPKWAKLTTDRKRRPLPAAHFWIFAIHMGRTGRDSHAAGSKRNTIKHGSMNIPWRGSTETSPCSSASLCFADFTTDQIWRQISWTGRFFHFKRKWVRNLSDLVLCNSPSEWKIPVPASQWMNDRGPGWKETPEKSWNSGESTREQLQAHTNLLWPASQLLSKVYAEAETYHATSTHSHSEDRVLLPGRLSNFFRIHVPFLGLQAFDFVKCTSKVAQKRSQETAKHNTCS